MFGKRRLRHSRGVDGTTRTTARPGIHVLIVDADWRVRQSLSGLIALGEQIGSVETAGDVETALRLVERSCPDVVLIDPRLPDVDGGLAFLAAVRRCWPTVRIIAMSASYALEDPARASGCVAFVAKGAQPGAFLDAIRDVLSVPPHLSR